MGMDNYVSYGIRESVVLVVVGMDYYVSYGIRESVVVVVGIDIISVVKSQEL